MSARERAWWDEGVLYEIYVRSFMDADGDGVGDLEGIRRRLDHVAWLGIDGIWLTPIYPSPNRDWGYDVTDHLDVAAEFGGLEAFDRLVADAHDRGLHVVLDLVPNHTSDRHPWFLEALTGRGAPMRDRYVWADPAPDGGPPNNWQSHFGGPAWTFEPGSGQFYLHQFLPQQPDLNWWNDDVRDAFDEILRFWFARGVDGFRIDVAHGIVKDRELRDDPADSPAQASGQVGKGSHKPRSELREPERFSAHRPEVHEVFRRWRAIADEQDPPRVLIGETWARDLPDLALYYGAGAGLNLAFNFAFSTAPFDGRSLRSILEATDRALGDDAWPVWTASNHDIGRLASRWGNEDPVRIRCALFVLLLLRGTPVIYAGDEIGLSDVPVPSERRRDPGRRADGAGRDDGRTPMVWTSATGHGFTDDGVEPWLPFGREPASVAEQRADPTSLLSWCRSVISVRRSRAELRRGGNELLASEAGVLSWRRALPGQGETVLAANVSAAATEVSLPEGEVLLTTGAVDRLAGGPHELGPWACVAVDADPDAR